MNISSFIKKVKKTMESLNIEKKEVKKKKDTVKIIKIPKMSFEIPVSSKSDSLRRFMVMQLHLMMQNYQDTYRIHSSEDLRDKIKLINSNIDAIHRHLLNPNYSKDPLQKSWNDPLLDKEKGFKIISNKRILELEQIKDRIKKINGYKSLLVDFYKIFSEFLKEYKFLKEE